MAPKVKELLARAYAAHGGTALTTLRTFAETSEVRASGPLGIRAPSQRNDVWLDRNILSGRWQMTAGGKMRGVYQQMPGGVFLWTEKNGTQKVRETDSPFSFVPLLRTGVLGLLALQNTADILTYIESGEIKGKKGAMIVRTQAVSKDTLLLAGRGGLSRTVCRTTWSYLFASDGTLIAERITQTQPGRVVDMQLSYDRFGIFDGVKVPTEISVKSNQVPRGFSLKMQVKQVWVNAPVDAARFQMP